MIGFLHKRSGFTLIELLIVIAIIALLTSVLMANFAGSRERGRDVRRKEDFASLKSALQLYYNDYGKYPQAGAGNTIAGCGASGTSVCAWTSGTTSGDPFSAGNPATTYMGTMPGDPSSPGQQYTYAQDANVDYIISTKLENASDTDAAKSQTRCGVAANNVQPLVYMVCNQ